MGFSSDKILIAGGSGFLGTRLSELLRAEGYFVQILQREIYQNNAIALAELIDSSLAVINLAGASIAKRWSKKYMNELIESRVKSTRNIVEAIHLSKNKPKFLISASATGIYGDSDQIHDEKSKSLAGDFLGRLGQQWEGEALKADSITKVRIIRLGIILGAKGGVIKRLKPVFKMMLGGRLGSGKQPFPFIHIDDACRAVLHVLDTTSNENIYNFVAPEITNNREFTRAFSRACRRPAPFIIPAFMLKIVFGKGAGFMLGGQKVYPAQLLKEHFKFQFPGIESTLADICK